MRQEIEEALKGLSEYEQISLLSIVDLYGEDITEMYLRSKSSKKIGDADTLTFIVAWEQARKKLLKPKNKNKIEFGWL